MYRIVVRPPVTLERLEHLCEEMLHASAVLLFDLGSGDPQDASGTLVASDRNFVTMAGKAVGDGLPLPDVDSLFPTAVGGLRPDDVVAALGKRLTVQVDAQEAALVTVVATSPPRQAERGTSCALSHLALRVLDARRAVGSLRSPQGAQRERAQESPHQRADDVIDPVAHRDKGVGHASGDSPDREVHGPVDGWVGLRHLVPPALGQRELRAIVPSMLH